MTFLLFYLHENKKNHFHISGFALSLALKQRLETALKWPIGWLGGLSKHWSLRLTTLLREHAEANKARIFRRI